MEETPIFSRKNSSHAEKPEKARITPEGKINELHDLIQGYVYCCDRKRVQNILPIIERAKVELHSTQEQKQKALAFKPSEQQLVLYYKTKNRFIQVIKILGKKIESSKSKLQAIKIEKKQIEQQLKKNQELLSELQEKCHESRDGKSSIILGKFPRISGFNYNLHHVSPKRMTNSLLTPLANRPPSPTKSQDQKQNFYNSINFRRLKQIQKLLDEITIECHSFKFEKLLAGDKSESIAKKVFKNFSITQYFDKFMHEKKVLKFLLKIQKQ